ncbi:sortase domain-bontaining protein [Streptomyces tibetensis]|uniref:class F sortase n=1 Tax=Streptomyces tibetensis TaxID=2382123 RepID=UPI0038138ED4
MTGPIVAAAALAAVLGLPARPSQPAAPAPDVTTAPSGRTADSTTAPPGRTADSTTAPSGRRADSATKAAPSTAPASPPRRVLLPRTGVDARVTPVGVTDHGEMAVPDEPSVAGWYRYGPAPGSASGSAVLVGHVDSDTGVIGEFAALYDVRRGDGVEVRRAGAEPVRYRVVSRATVPKDELPPSAFRRTGAPVLTLITCAPPFVPERGGYLSNLVVTAEPVRSGRAQWPT